jgi:hypothetical protein
VLGKNFKRSVQYSLFVGFLNSRFRFVRCGHN